MSNKVNKINIYLIKEGIELDNIFTKPISDYSKIEDVDYDLYYDPKSIYAPSWVKDFFKTTFTKKTEENKIISIFNSASSQAALIRKLTFVGQKLTFVITFGNGHHMLNKEAYVKKFGLKTVLNVIDENNLKKIDKHDISGTPRHTAEQLSKSGSQIDFNLNIETDMLTGVVGSFKKSRKAKIATKDRFMYKIFGTTLSGKNNLNINANFDIEDIDKLLKIAYIAFNVKRYTKKGFDWIDNIDLVKETSDLYKNLCTELDTQLANLTDENNKIWLSVPEIIKWEDVKGFYYGSDDENLDNDIFIEDLKASLDNDEVLSINKLKRTYIKAKHSNGNSDAYVWSAFECLYSEIDYQDEKYMLINSQWYKLDKNFVKSTNDKYEILKNKRLPLTLCNYNNKDENDYNNAVSHEITNSLCMDAKNISYGGKYSKIEFCDIFDVDNSNLIHIKKYAGSSVLSHLFSQGYVSADLLLNDSKFKEEVAKKAKTLNPDFSFSDTHKYNVIFGIVAKPQKTDIEIPFFSKVNLNNFATKIQGMKGYDVFLQIIPNDNEKTINDESESESESDE